MNLTLAQVFYLNLCHGCENLGRDYKSSKANQPTPQRRKKKSSYKPFKLFKGHRA